MTTEPGESKPAPPRGNPLTKPILLAGLLGGVLGAVCSFALARALPAPVPRPSTPPSEARQFADFVLGKLKEGKTDEFMGYLRQAFAQMNNEQFAQFHKNMFDARAEKLPSLGAGSEFEFCRESTLSPTLVRVTYLEKFANGCLLWTFVVYNAPAGWRMAAFSVHGSDRGFPELQ